MMGKGEWLEIKVGEIGSSHVMKGVAVGGAGVWCDLVYACIKWLQTFDIYSQ